VRLDGVQRPADAGRGAAQLVTDGPGQLRHVAVVAEGRVDPLRVVEVGVAHVPAPFGLRGRVTLQVGL
jgi:hypothetical protein